MRALEILIFMLCVALALPLVNVLVPAYNGGNGVDTGTADLSSATAFNMSTLEKYQLSENSSILDQAGYYFQLFVLAITGIATMLFSSIKLAPALLSVFNVHPVLTGVLLSALAIITILAWLQIAKGDDWSGKR